MPLELPTHSTLPPAARISIPRCRSRQVKTPPSLFNSPIQREPPSPTTRGSWPVRERGNRIHDEQSISNLPRHDYGEKNAHQSHANPHIPNPHHPNRPHVSNHHA